MEQTSVQKLARVLRVLVLITLVCNLIALLCVPVAVGLYVRNDSIVDLMGELLQEIFAGEEAGNVLLFSLYFIPVLFLGCYAEVWQGAYTVVLTLFLWTCGSCTAIILWQGRRVLDTILKGNPFVKDNAKSLKRAAVCCFVISGAALARLIWGFAYYQSIAPLFTYNALFVPIFLMGGLLFMVMSALFRQAAELKAENDLTI